MRRLMFIAVLAIAGSFAGGAQALPAGPNPGLANAANSQIENVAVVCRNVWNGWGWVRQCVRTRPYNVAPGYYVGPRYYGGPRFHRHYRRW